jgi:predicted metal-dependent hydrolase
VWRKTGGDGRLEIGVSGRAEHLARRLKDWLKREALRALAARSTAHALTLGLTPTAVRVRDTRTRWGSCSTSGTLSFSWRLVLAPAFVLDYVAAHETVHRVHMHHRASFWRLVDELAPHRREADVWLDAFGSDLHRFGAGASGVRTPAAPWREA